MTDFFTVLLTLAGEVGLMLIVVVIMATIWAIGMYLLYALIVTLLGLDP